MSEMFPKLLFVVDLSERSPLLLPVMRQIHEVSGGEALLLHVFESKMARGSGQASAESLRRVREELDRFAREFYTGQVTPMLVQGDPWVEIMHIAAKEDISCIVMGSHTGEEVTRMTLGDITEKVLHHSQRSLFIINEQDASLGLATDIFRKIFYATDFSPSGERCIPYLDMLIQPDSEVVIAHIQDLRSLRYASAEQMERFDQIDLKRLEKLKDHFTSSAGITPEIILKTGNAIEELLGIIRAEDISLAVFGEKGKTNVREMLLGGVVETVVHRSPAHTLIVR